MHEARHVREARGQCRGQTPGPRDQMVAARVPANEQRLQQAEARDRTDQGRQVAARARPRAVDLRDRNQLDLRDGRLRELLDVVRVVTHAKAGRQPFPHRLGLRQQAVEQLLVQRVGHARNLG